MILKDSGYAMIGIGKSNGVDRAIDATTKALDKLQVTPSTGVMIQITSDEDFILNEFDQIMDTKYNKMGRELTFIAGYNKDVEMNAYIKVSIIMFGVSY